MAPPPVQPHPDFPFLYISADGPLVYRAQQPGDLRRLLEAVRGYPDLAQAVARVELDEDLDSMEESGVLQFAAAYSVEVDSTAREEDNWETDEDIDNEEEVEDEGENHNMNADACEAEMEDEKPVKEQAEAYIDLDGPDNENGPPLGTSSSPPVTPLSPPVSAINDESLPSPEDDDNHLDPFRTAVEDFTLVKHTSGISPDDVSEDLYLDLLAELLSVFKNVESVVHPAGWEKVFPSLK